MSRSLWLEFEAALHSIFFSIWRDDRHGQGGRGGGYGKGGVTLRCVQGAAALAMCALSLQGCGSGLPEVRPDVFSKPHSVETRGRMVQKAYRRANGPHRTINYKIIEVDGQPVRFKDGYIWKTSWCEVDGIEAVAFVARGKPGVVAGIWILQLDGNRQILERICEFNDRDPAPWDGAHFKGCEVGWDAQKKQRIVERDRAR